MATYTSKYGISKNGAIFIDLDLPFKAPTLADETILVSGSAEVDMVFVRPGLSVDLTRLGGGTDKIYLEGNFADYDAAVSGANLTLTRQVTVNGQLRTESVTISAGVGLLNDILIFRDGYVSSLAVKQSIATGRPPALNTGETSQVPVLPAALTGEVTAEANNPAGSTMASMPGMALMAKGSASADTVYVKAGSTVDATGLGGGSDQIYLTGRYTDYTKTASGSNLALTRTVNGHTEKVTVNAGTGHFNDTLIFADGTIASYTARTNPPAPLGQTVWTPGTALGAPAIAEVTDDAPGTVGPVANNGLTNDNTLTVKVTFAPVNAVGNRAMTATRCSFSTATPSF